MSESLGVSKSLLRVDFLLAMLVESPVELMSLSRG